MGERGKGKRVWKGGEGIKREVDGELWKGGEGKREVDTE